jgi:hypothetical protein
MNHYEHLDHLRRKIAGSQAVIDEALKIIKSTKKAIALIGHMQSDLAKRLPREEGTHSEDLFL